MAMILEAQLPLPRCATSEELLSMGLHEHVRLSDAPSVRDSGSSAADDEIFLCF
jgi:hypothetical protein